MSKLLMVFAAVYGATMLERMVSFILPFEWPVLTITWKRGAGWSFDGRGFRWKDEGKPATPAWRLTVNNTNIEADRAAGDVEP